MHGDVGGTFSGLLPQRLALTSLACCRTRRPGSTLGGTRSKIIDDSESRGCVAGQPGAVWVRQSARNSPKRPVPVTGTKQKLTGETHFPVLCDLWSLIGVDTCYCRQIYFDWVINSRAEVPCPSRARIFLGTPRQALGLLLRRGTWANRRRFKSPNLLSTKGQSRWYKQKCYYIYKRIKSRLNSRNARYHSFHSR